VLTWIGTHLSIQLKKWKKKQVIPNLYPPAGHPHRWHLAAGHHLQGGSRPAPPQARRRPARNGAGRRSAGDGAGRGDPLEMGKERIAAGRQGCSEVEARWLATGRRRQHQLFCFFIGLTSGLLSSSVQIEFSLPAQHLQVGPTYQIWCQFATNSRSV
jgi:hypothetical protein